MQLSEARQMYNKIFICIVLLLVALVGCSQEPQVQTADSDQAAADSIGSDIDSIPAEEMDFSELDSLDQDLNTLE